MPRKLIGIDADDKGIDAVRMPEEYLGKGGNGTLLLNRQDDGTYKSPDGRVEYTAKALQALLEDIIIREDSKERANGNTDVSLVLYTYTVPDGKQIQAAKKGLEFIVADNKPTELDYDRSMHMVFYEGMNMAAAAERRIENARSAVDRAKDSLAISSVTYEPDNTRVNIPPVSQDVLAAIRDGVMGKK